MADRLQIDSLRVRLQGGAASGRRFANDLAGELSRHVESLVGNDSAPVRLEGLRLSVRSTSPASAAETTGAALARAIAKATRHGRSPTSR